MRLVIHVHSVDEHAPVVVGSVGGMEVGDVVMRILQVLPVAEGLVAVLDELLFGSLRGDGAGLVVDRRSGMLKVGEREAVDAVIANGLNYQPWQSAELPRACRGGNVLTVAHRPLPSVQLAGSRLAQVEDRCKG